MTHLGIYSPRITAIARSRGITELQAYRAEKQREILLERLRAQRKAYVSRQFRNPALLLQEKV